VVVVRGEASLCVCACALRGETRRDVWFDGIVVRACVRKARV